MEQHPVVAVLAEVPTRIRGDPGNGEVLNFHRCRRNVGLRK